MAYTIFFKDGNQIHKAEKFIREQPVGHRDLLTKIAEEISSHGTTRNPKASKNAKGDWSVILNDNGDIHVYTMYVSKIELPDKEIQKTNRQETPTLVIINPIGSRDSIGDTTLAIGQSSSM